MTSRFKVQLPPPRSLVQTTLPTLAVIVCPNRASGRTSDTSAYAPRTWRGSDQQPRCPTQCGQSPDCPGRQHSACPRRVAVAQIVDKPQLELLQSKESSVCREGAVCSRTQAVGQADVEDTPEPTPLISCYKIVLIVYDFMSAPKNYLLKKSPER